jgi:hypothetical protein
MFGSKFKVLLWLFPTKYLEGKYKVWPVQVVYR